MSIIVSRYAAALHQASCELEGDTVENDIKVLYELTFQNKKLNLLLHRPTTKNELLSTITQGMSPLVINFCRVLIMNNRLALLSNIAEKFLQLSKEKRGEVDVIVTSTAPLTKDHIEKIKNSMNTDKIINIINHIDKSILGGIMIQYGYRVLDLSLKHKLEMLQAVSKQGVLTCN